MAMINELKATPRDFSSNGLGKLTAEATAAVVMVQLEQRVSAMGVDITNGVVAAVGKPRAPRTPSKSSDQRRGDGDALDRVLKNLANR